MTRRVAVLIALAVAGLFPTIVAGGPARAAVVCHGRGTLSTSAPLFYPPAAPRSVTFLAGSLTPVGCSFSGSMTNATCAGGILFDGTPIALQPVDPQDCAVNGPGEMNFFYAV
jgi:hypothetical protein